MKIEELNRLLSYMAYKIFKPLVVLFLRNSIPYQTASDWMKRIYIDTAFDNKEFRINPDKKQTKTRVAVLTGLSRVEIDRILKIEKPLEVTEQKWNRATKVLSAWCNDQDFLEKGKPAILPIYGEKSFTTLVEKYSGGATMRSIMDELLNVESIEKINDEVKLIRQDYMPVPNKQKLLNIEISGFSTGQLLNTLVYNEKEENSEKKRFQKVVIAWKVPDTNIQIAKNYIYQETDKLLIKIDNKLNTLNGNIGKMKTHTIGLGAYYFQETNDE